MKPIKLFLTLSFLFIAKITIAQQFYFAPTSLFIKPIVADTSFLHVNLLYLKNKGYILDLNNDFRFLSYSNFGMKKSYIYEESFTDFDITYGSIYSKPTFLQNKKLNPYSNPDPFDSIATGITYYLINKIRK